MAIKSSGSLSMVTDIVGEFGGTAPHGLKEYYRNGSAGVSPNNTNIPTSGAIGFKTFYNAVLQFEHTISGNHLQMNLNTYLVGQGWNGDDPVVLTIPSGTWLWSDNTSYAGLTIPSNLNNKLTIHHYGKIIGKGGNGGTAGYQNGNPSAATAGGPAVSNSAAGVVLHTYSGSYIAGGGGGGGAFKWGAGGGGAGGGKGGNSGPRHTTLSGGAGGGLGQAGANGASWGSPYTDTNYCGSDGGSGDPRGLGGGAGGGGGTSIDTGSSCNVYMGTGGGGGRILPGVGGAGGDRSGPYRSSSTEGGTGGSANGVGRNGIGSYGNEDGAGGGGGWGAAGGNAVGASALSGAAGGAAWAGTNWASRPTASGTIYGTT